jgi:hypothetical protein
MASITASAIRWSVGENCVMCICQSRCSRSVVGALLRASMSGRSSSLRVALVVRVS